MSEDSKTRPDSPRRPGEEPGREALRLAVILAVALGLRITFTFQVQTGPLQGRQLFSGTDMEKHDLAARSVLANGWWEKSADLPPLYPYAVLPLLYKLTDNNVFHVLILQGILDSITVLLIYLLARRLFGTRAAGYAGLAAALYAPFIVYQGHVLGESILNLFVAGFFLATVGADGAMSAKRALWAGILLGFAGAANPACLVFAPLAAVFIWKEAGWRLCRAAATVSVMALGCLAVMVPFAWRNYRATGEFRLIPGSPGLALYMGNNPAAIGERKHPSDAAAMELARRAEGLSAAETDRLYRNAALSFMADNPRRALGLMWRKFRLFFGAREAPSDLSVKLYRQTTFLEPKAFATFGLVFPFAIVGFALAARRRGCLFAGAQIALYSATIIAFVVADRHRLAILPLAIPAAGFAAAELIYAAKSLKFTRAFAILMPIVATAVMVNRADLSAAVKQRLHPEGFVESSEDVTYVHDDGDRPTPFGVQISGPKTVAAKAIIVPASLRKLGGAAVLIQLAVEQPGVLSVEVNDYVAKMDLHVQPRQWVKALLPVEAIKQGENYISLTSDDGLRAFIFADDTYHFGRSIYTPDGVRAMRDRLDRLSYLSDPTLHIGGREFKIRLELEHASGPDGG